MDLKKSSDFSHSQPPLVQTAQLKKSVNFVVFELGFEICSSNLKYKFQNNTDFVLR